jgi:hypothetical protein
MSMKRIVMAALAGLLAAQSGASLGIEPGPASCSGPIKRILLIKRKPGTTHEAFRDYYETQHAQLALKLLGDLMLDYRRNYVQPADPSAAGTPRPGIDHDVVTELWFKDRAMMEAFYARVRRPEIAAQIAADEEKFMDRPALRQAGVDECQTRK